jgi:hypothetical protein
MGGCSSPLEPLPAGGVPKDQIVEGAIQVRVSSTGLQTVSAFAAQLIRNMFGAGICLPRQAAVFEILGIDTTVRACEETNMCGGGAQGCKIVASVASVNISTPSAQVVRLSAKGITGQAATTVRADVDLGWLGTLRLKCAVTLKIKKLDVEADADIGTHASTGEIAVGVRELRALNIDVDLGGCAAAELAGVVINGLELIINTQIGLFVVDLLTPFIDDFIQTLLPSPLGLEGKLDLGALLASFLPGIESTVEVSAIPGGYLTAPNEGISVGLMLGLNADSDPATRDPADDSQPARCVPAWPTPDLSARLGAPNARGHFVIPPVGGFLGEENFGADVALGLSETLLDQAGYHLLSSGALCLGVDSSFAPQLNLGTIGILVPSLATLGTGKEPVLLQIRPTRPLDFDIVEDDGDPLLAAHLSGMEIDFYAYVLERYVRAFTISVAADVQIGVEYMPDDQGNPVLVPILKGLDAESISVEVANTDLLKETPAQLDAVFPTILNLVIPLIGSAIPEIAVPPVLGFTLGDLRLQKVETAADDFLAVFASLAEAPPALTGKRPRPEVPRVTATATVTRVANPSPDAIHKALVTTTGGALPEIELALGGHDPEGRRLEWQWRLDGLMWRPFSTSPTLVIRDPSLALQAKHVIEVRARAVGAPLSLTRDPVRIPVTIDSLAPRVLVDKIERRGDQVLVPAVDAVHDDGELVYAVGRPDASQAQDFRSSEGWFAYAELARAAANGKVRVFARDPLGNTGSELVDLATLGEAPASGCGVAPGGESGNLWVLLGLAAVLAALHRKRLLLFLVAAACSGTNPGAPECEVDLDCADKCPTGEVGLCFDNVCSCSDDIPLGDVGAYSDLALDEGGTVWVSAYNKRHGDLMVAETTATGRIANDSWVFVDGVPDGPVVLEDSDVRGGIGAPGDDVGRYTSIAVTPSGPVVAYYDSTHASLKLAVKSGDSWQTTTVDSGAPADDPPSRDVGRYASLTLDPTGNPGIAYLAVVKENDEVWRTEVRFAQASTPTPSGAGDWNVTVVDSQPMPVESEGDLLLDDAPRLVGLFIASARKADGSPVVAYYDHVAGTLRVTSATGGAFGTPVVVARAGGDVGWAPSVAVSPTDQISVSYVDVTRGELLYQTLPDGAPELVDDGFRTDGTTADGLPRPVQHRVGDDSGLFEVDGKSVVVYQDATTHELVMATRTAAAGWERTSIAGAEATFAGAYGFHIAGEAGGADLVLSSYVLDLGEAQQWVELFRQTLFIE